MMCDLTCIWRHNVRTQRHVVRSVWVAQSLWWLRCGLDDRETDVQFLRAATDFCLLMRPDRLGSPLSLGLIDTAETVTLRPYCSRFSRIGQTDALNYTQRIYSLKVSEPWWEEKDISPALLRARCSQEWEESVFQSCFNMCMVFKRYRKDMETVWCEVSPKFWHEIVKRYNETWMLNSVLVQYGI
jgi:hypothetical protein